MKRRSAHRWTLSVCFVFGLFFLKALTFSQGIPANEGHRQSEKKSFQTAQTAEGKKHGMDKGTGGHSAEEKGHGHGEAQKDLNPLQEKGFRLTSDLHCNACHYISAEFEHGAGHKGGHTGVAPDLTNLGSKFRPDWLFEFLQKPQVIRPWLKIRMPDFYLTEKEALALVRHISKDMVGPSRLSLPPVKLSSAEWKTFLEAGKRLMSAEYFDCWSCHQIGDKKPEGPMEGWAPDLEISGQRLRRDWIVQWLQDPQKLMPGTKMPTYFEGSDSGPDEILGGDETRQIYAIVEYVLSLSEERSSTYAIAERLHPLATRAWGAQLMNELNCSGCHDVGEMHERLEAGPPLAHEGSRVRKEWLTGFLKNPSQIRPIGYTAGRNSRMPNFKLSSEDVSALAGFLMTLKDKRTHEHTKLHAGQAEKVKQGAGLFASRHCKACHQMKGRPEWSLPPRFAGPDLGFVGRRLKEDHLKFWLAGDVTRSGSNLEMDTHPVVPNMRLTRKQVEELSAYLITLK